MRWYFDETTNELTLQRGSIFHGRLGCLKSSTTTIIVMQSFLSISSDFIKNLHCPELSGTYWPPPPLYWPESSGLYQIRENISFHRNKKLFDPLTCKLRCCQGCKNHLRQLYIDLHHHLRSFHRRQLCTDQRSQERIVLHFVRCWAGRHMLLST